jgi:putative transposase
MITDYELFCNKKGISDWTKNYISDSIRYSDPSRRVRSGIGNVRGFYSSKKMGIIIESENHT